MQGCLLDSLGRSRVGKELLEWGAIFFGSAVDGSRRRLRLDAAAVIGRITIAERGSEIDALGCNILLIAVLVIEDVPSFDGSEVAGLVVVSGGIFDVVESKLVVTSGGDSCAGVGASS